MMRAFLLLTLFALTACGGGGGGLIPNPTIENREVFWERTGGGRVLEAEVNIPEGITVDAIYARYTRHYWPGAKDAHDVEAQLVPGSTTRYRVVPTQAVAGLRADHLFWEWFIDYRRGSSGVITARSASEDAPHDMVIGCTAADTEATLRTIRLAAAQFDDEYGNNPGYPIFSHIIPASLLNQGVPMARASKLFSLDDVSVNQPDLLQFAPRARFPGESEAIYQQMITDSAPDKGSRLAALSYGVFHNSATRRPQLGCVPSSEWFIHEAGAHTQNGGMRRFQVDEEVRGMELVNGLAPPAGFNMPAGSVWHPRIWDLHAWLPEDETALPILQIDSPFPIPGLAMAPGLFFYSEVFE